MSVLDEMVDGINILIDTNVKAKSFAEVVDGMIVQENEDGSYKVKINNEHYNMELYIKRELKPYDLVKIVKQDSSLNNAFIL